MFEDFSGWFFISQGIVLSVIVTCSVVKDAMEYNKSWLGALYWAMSFWWATISAIFISAGVIMLATEGDGKWMLTFVQHTPT